MQSPRRGWVHSVATVWLGHWLGGGYGRPRPEVWGLVRGPNGVRAQATEYPVLGEGGEGGGCPLSMPLAAEWEPGALLSVCPCTRAGSRAWVSLHPGGQGGVRQGPLSQRWVSDAAATPRASGQLPARGAGPCCSGADWTPLLGELRGKMVVPRGRGALWPGPAPAAAAGAPMVPSAAHLSGEH